MTSKRRSEMRQATLNGARRLRERQVSGLILPPNLWLRTPDGQEFKIKGIILEEKEGLVLTELIRLTLERHYPDCTVFFKVPHDA